jgi:phosphatidate phosphatase
MNYGNTVCISFQIYIEKRLQIRFSKLLKLFLQTGLIFAAILCGLGRIIDNKHHPSDVLAGFVLGSIVAIVVVSNVLNLSFNSM